MIKKFIKKFKASFITKIIYYRYKAIRSAKELELKQDNLHYIQKDDIILVAVMKNEAHRLTYFLEYYRGLGVNHFILIDNGSNDHFNEIIKNEKDITTYFTTSSYKDANFGMYWINFILSKYGSNHWCITCDPDECLIYPYMDTRTLRDLTNYLDLIQQNSFFTLMIDMYSDKAVEDCYYKEGTNPLEICSYFDATGYVKSKNKEYHNLFVQGGVRKRVFYAENPKKAPALNKVCLVKWQWYYAYVSSMHMLFPKRLNEVYSATTGAVLHFKFIAQLTQKVEEEKVAKQHWDNSSEYIKYASALQEKTLLYEPNVSVKYESWKSLQEFGLINRGKW